MSKRGMYITFEKRGILIAFEGIDKSGKGTLSRRFAKAIHGTRISFPRYETPVGKLIKRHLLGNIALRYEHSIDSSDIRIDGDIVHRVDDGDDLMFQSLMFADKADAVASIEDLLRLGPVVLDRWKDSASAYGEADGLDRAWLSGVQTVLPDADVTFLLRISPEVAAKRGRAVGDDRTQDDRYEKNLEKMKRVADNYDRIFSERPKHGERIVIDAEQTEEQVWGAVLKEYKLLVEAEGDMAIY